MKVHWKKTRHRESKEIGPGSIEIGIFYIHIKIGIKVTRLYYKLKTSFSSSGLTINCK